MDFNGKGDGILRNLPIFQSYYLFISSAFDNIIDMISHFFYKCYVIQATLRKVLLEFAPLKD